MGVPGILGRGSKVIWVQLPRLELVICMAVLLFAVLAMAGEVVLRYVLGVSIMRLEEVASYAIVWAYFMGAAYASYERTHITAGIAHLFLHGYSQSVVRLASSVVTFSLLCCACIWAHQYFLWGTTMGETCLPPWDVPMVCFQSAIYVGLLLMSLHALVELTDNARTVLEARKAQEG
jgi:TRAP-type C4-dicarboxylate transport system permease small subunit